MTTSTLHKDPLHAAIIMDGNGRWAQLRSLPRVAGHQAGAEALRKVVTAAPSAGVTSLTVYAFSSDNWKRPALEVGGLMALLAWYLETETPRCVEEGVRLSVIGRRDRLDSGLVRAIEQSEEATRQYQALHLRLAIDYSARESILRAMQGAQGSAELTDVPPVDLLIRTGGEQRLSDFLLWECAYAELIFTPVMWPDFSAADLRRALHEYRRRDRRFGGLHAAVHQETFADRWLR